MCKEDDNKAIVGRWFKDFWSTPSDLTVVDELATPDVLLQYSPDTPRRGRDAVRAFRASLRDAFPDLAIAGASLIADRDIVVVCWSGIGTHTGPAFDDFTIGPFPAASGRTVRLSGITAVRVENRKIAEEAVWMDASCRQDGSKSADVRFREQEPEFAGGLPALEMVRLSGGATIHRSTSEVVNRRRQHVED